jgi:hypothetical protein
MFKINSKYLARTGTVFYHTSIRLRENRLGDEESLDFSKNVQNLTNLPTPHKYWVEEA